MEFIEAKKHRGYFIHYSYYVSRYTSIDSNKETIYIKEKDADIAMVIYKIGMKYVKDGHRVDVMREYVLNNIHYLFLLKIRLNISFEDKIDGNKICGKLFHGRNVYQISMEYFPNDVLFYECQIPELT